MSRPPTSFELRPDWLAARTEPAIDPGQPVIDSHHHLYVRPGVRYLIEEYGADLACGHDVRATVAVQARGMLRVVGPPQEASLGETEFLNGQAAMSASGLFGRTRIAAGIVGHVDLRMGDGVRPLLERHVAAAGGTTRQGGRFCGIRQPLAWDADGSLLNAAYPTTETMADDAAFLRGLAVLDEMGLGFEIWAYYPQMPRLARMARAVPGLPIVVNHLGGVVRAGAHADRDIFDDWRAGMKALAAVPNVAIKLSGLGMRLSGFGFDEAPLPPSSDQLAAAWRPWTETALELFGSSRCMWGSNFPVDKGSYAFSTGLNAVKRLLAEGSANERHDVFWRTAARHYGLDPEPIPAPSA